MSEQKATIANALKRLRKLNKMTQDEISEKLGIARGSYLTYENGRNNIPFETVIKFASVCKVPLDVLAGNKDLDTFLQQREALGSDTGLGQQIAELQDLETLRAIAAHLHEQYTQAELDYASLQESLRKLASIKR